MQMSLTTFIKFLFDFYFTYTFANYTANKTRKLNWMGRQHYFHICLKFFKHIWTNLDKTKKTMRLMNVPLMHSIFVDTLDEHVFCGCFYFVVRVHVYCQNSTTNNVKKKCKKNVKKGSVRKQLWFSGVHEIWMGSPHLTYSYICVPYDIHKCASSCGSAVALHMLSPTFRTHIYDVNGGTGTIKLASKWSLVVVGQNVNLWVVFATF